MSTEIERQTATDDLLKDMRKKAQEFVSPELVKFNSWLEAKPRAEWIKEQAGIPYIPIRIVEDLLTSFFGDWSVDFAQGGAPQIVGNAVACSVTLTVINPVTGKERRLAGSGAVPIQLSKTITTKEGEYVSGKRHNLDFENINSKAIQLAAPAALSFAISNAAKKLGRIFGANITQESDFYLGVANMYEAQQVKGVTTLQEADDEILRLLSMLKGDTTLMRAELEKAKASGDWSLEKAKASIKSLVAKVTEDEN